MSTSYFDGAAAEWENEPRRLALAKAVGEAIVREARPNNAMDVLDYGTGTGLVGLFLLPHVRSVTGADSSPKMLEVLRGKIAAAGIRNMSTILFDLEREPVPPDRYDMIVTVMTMHHVADTDRVLRGFHELLRPAGTLCISDLDSEPGVFHSAEALGTVHHHGLDRGQLKQRLERTGFHEVRDVTVHTIRKPVEGGEERDFPVFLITARRR